MLTSARAASTDSSASLVDADAVEALLSADLDIRWPGDRPPSVVRVERVWPVGDGRLGVEWSLALAGGERCSIQVMPTDARDADLVVAKEPIFRGGVLRGLRVPLRDDGVVLHSMDHDDVLTRLSDGLDSEAMRRRLSSHWAPDGKCADIAPMLEVRLLSYRARRRATLRYRRGGQHLIGKVFRDDRGERCGQLHFALREALFRTTGGRIVVPAALDYLPDLRMLLLGWSDARELPAGFAPADDLWMLLRALAALHRTAVADLPAFTCADEVEVVERWERTLTRAAPNRTLGLRRLIPIWRLRTPPIQRCVTVHRDFYARQVLLSDGKATLIDLDTLSRGDGAVDVGNFLAHLWLDALQHAGDVADVRFTDQARESIAAYQSCGGRLRRVNLRWYWASALLRLGAVHRLRTLTGRYSDALWALAANLIGAGDVFESPRTGADRDRGPLPNVDSMFAEIKE